ncbi:MAG: LysM peptidoglycan-binding domain-containing M23 family metallopeptidase [Pelolinea sp.]|nr:LysM peptidoglycan-binding domain-containing M23 family metallopeptidase [Pelolinea sp.]
MAFSIKKDEQTEDRQNGSTYPLWLTAVTWVVAVLMIGLMGFSLFQYFSGRSLLAFINSPSNQEIITDISTLPDFIPTKVFESVERSTNPDTVLPVGSRKEVVEYTVASGDSLFGIAKQYEVEPESVLWANTDTLNDDPHLISVGERLKIPPVDGILYLWKEGNKLEEVAGKYNASVEDILLYPGNDLDLSNPTIEPGTILMIPDGWRPLQPWVIPVSAGNDAGVTAQIAGPGSCSPSGGSYGTYSFIWPTPYYGQVSGNDYWSGHQAIDAQCFQGDSIFASDSGVVIYSGPISGGYGNLVAIDHQNGYLTLYAHLSGFNVACGQSVGQGQVVGFCGSTGNSTGAHLHFEVRQNGGFVNPWYVLQ